MGDHLVVNGEHAESIGYISLLVGTKTMRAMLKSVVKRRVGVAEPLGGAFADWEGVHFIIDGKERLTIPWRGADNT